MRFRAADKSDVPKLTALWLDSFHEKEEAVKLFFERNLSYTHIYLAERDGELTAAVYLIDCRLCGKPSHYLCGAATKRAYRGRGVMTALIGHALRDAAERGDHYSALLPADEGLYRFYAKLGYSENGAACQKEFTAFPAEGMTAAAPGTQALQRRCGGDKFLLWNDRYIQFAAEYYACYGARVIRENGAIAFFERDGDRAEVFYAIYPHLNTIKDLLYRQGVRRFILTGGVGNPDLADCPPLRCGMLRPLRENLPVPDGVWIGLTLS